MNEAPYFPVKETRHPVPARDWLWEMLSPEGRQKLADTYRFHPHLRPQEKSRQDLRPGG